jgi:hypothetical protein
MIDREGAVLKNSTGKVQSAPIIESTLKEIRDEFDNVMAALREQREVLP